MAIILRQDKGSELTFQEVDNNFQSLYYSSSLEGDTLNFYFTGSNISHSIDLSYVGIGAAQSIQGLQGLIQGIQGRQGIQGLQGIQGRQGIQGTSVQGIQGAQGIQGRQGVQGYKGIQGIQGEKGIQGERGLLGAQGVQGVQGIIGSQGIQGNIGIQGRIGIQGIQGTQGIIGSQGIQGNIGIQGFRGMQGIQGIQGMIGSQGIQGMQGIQGQQGDNLTLGSFAFILSSITPTDIPSTEATFTVNNSNFTSVNIIKVSDTDERSINQDGLLNVLRSGSLISLIPVNDKFSQEFIYQISSSVDNSNHWVFGVRYLSGNSYTAVPNDEYYIRFDLGGVGGGDSGPSAQGIQGPQGIQGTQGIQGIQGANGGGSGGVSGSYFVKLLYDNSGLVNPGCFSAASSSEGTNLLAGGSGWTFTRNTADKITITHPENRFFKSFTRIAENTPGNYITTEYYRADPTYGLIQTTSSITLQELTGVRTGINTGPSGSGSGPYGEWVLYITWDKIYSLIP